MAFDNGIPILIDGSTAIYLTEFERDAAKEVRLTRCDGCMNLIGKNALQECSDCDMGNLCPPCMDDPQRHGCENG